MRGLLLAGLVLLAAAALADPPRAPAPEWKGDFGEMLERRVIRFAVPYSRTLYVNDRGRELGLSAELARDFERYLNRKYRRRLGTHPLEVHLIATSRNELLPNVANGLADVAAGNLTVTESRSSLVDFVAPADRKPNTELVLTRAGGPVVASVEDLAGKTVHVRKSSSYHESLQALNDRLRKEGKAPAKLAFVPEGLEDEDMMEMLNAGLVQVIVVDDWKAKMWAQILPHVRVNDQAAVGAGGVVGWAIRKESPELRAELEAFYDEFARKQGVYEERLKQAMRRVKQIRNNAAEAEIRKLRDTIALFRKYGEQYDFDPLMLAAQAYQESQLDQSTENYFGAIGVMQIMPATGANLKVGDIRALEPNIHGGAKYMDEIMTRYFADAAFTDANRSLFACASYRAGPRAIANMRTEAKQRGLDPNQWFNNVEVVTSEKIGIATTTYVRNVFKYYVAYKLAVEGLETSKVARDAAAAARACRSSCRAAAGGRQETAHADAGASAAWFNSSSAASTAATHRASVPAADEGVGPARRPSPRA
jgi:membrane-bound lytic murein transglycosylase MltF